MWQTKTKEEIFKELQSSKDGISQERAEKLLVENGKNVFPKTKKKTLLFILFSQFKSPIMIILFVAIAVSLAIAEYSNAIFVGAVVVINLIIGTFQEFNAEKSAEKLQSMIRVVSTIRRNGTKTTIDAEDLVVGDIVYLESGSKIPADIRLIETNNFTVDESILTGESEEVKKNCDMISAEQKSLCYKNMAYAGTVVLSGRAIGIVVATSLNTELGKIANSVINMKQELSPLIIRINKFTKQISLVFLCLIIVLSVILHFKGFSINEIFFSVIALTVSAIPEGLSTAMTISLSKSSKVMASKNVIVKKLSAVESLGSCTVIASDKTGTLTVNEQTAKLIVFPDGKEVSVIGEGFNDNGKINFNKKDINLCKHIDLATRIGAISNEGEFYKDEGRWVRVGDSIDVAFLALRKKFSNKYNDLSDVEVISRIPYESQNKYSATYYTSNGVNYLATKGATEKILELCDKMITEDNVAPIDKKLIMCQFERMAKDGYRVIALAYGKKEQLILTDANTPLDSLIFVGLVGFIDPVRPDAIDAVGECVKAGIKVYMITGDHPKTAYHIGCKLKMIDSYEQVTDGATIEEEYKKGEESFDKFIRTVRICARVSPIQKLQIVESLKRQGEFVAVTGDGVNDTAALKSANIGIAMGGGTDLAKETGDMIIKDDNFASIVGGVREGRVAYNNIRSVIYMLLSTGLSEVILYVLSILCNLPFPLLAVQFLWLNLITNGIESNAMAFEKSSIDVMNEKVKSTKEQIFNKLFIKECFLSSIIIATIAFVIYALLYWKLGLDINMVRTYLLVFMVFAEDIHVFNCRNESASLFKTPIRNNYVLVGTIISSIVVQTCIIYIPAIANIFSLVAIPFWHVILLLALTIPLLMAMEIFKLVNKKSMRKRYV